MYNHNIVYFMFTFFRNILWKSSRKWDC